MVVTKNFSETEPKKMIANLSNQKISTINKIKTLMYDEFWDIAICFIATVMAEGKTDGK